MISSSGSPIDSFDDATVMQEALRLARKGEGWVSPNPMVGAVVVRRGQIISRGFHRRFGGPHAEVEALAPLEGDLRDATLYVTLEPCCHHGKTPPCTELILSRGLGRVVIGAMDPSTQMAGRSIQILRDAGVKVTVGVYEEACRKLNRTFFHWIESGNPWVTLKWAQSLDGKIATSTGHAKWISSPASRKRAHKLRATHDALLVGIGTVVHDDPSLTVRYIRGRDPIRIVMDTHLQIPLRSKLVSVSSPERKTWVITAGESPQEKLQALEKRGIRVIECEKDHSDQLNLECLLRILADNGISSILVEGGGKVLTSFFKTGLFQRLFCFVAPMIMGRGKDAFDDLGISKVGEAFQFPNWKIVHSAEDIVIDVLMESENSGGNR